jgi:hypothetical protein
VSGKDKFKVERGRSGDEEGLKPAAEPTLTRGRFGLMTGAMGTPSDANAAELDARAHRRWLIGLGITLVFGLFGAVMTWLAYAGRSAPAAPAAAPPVPGSVAPAAPAGHGKNKGKGHGGE